MTRGNSFKNAEFIRNAAVLCLLAAGFAHAQADRNFQGTWRLDPERSDIAGMKVPADPTFRAEQSPVSLTLMAPSADGGPAAFAVYPLDGRQEKYQAGTLQKNTATKWEGSALLVNTIVTGSDSYSIAERWKRSNDGNTLTITRSIVRATGESEYVLVYVNAEAAPVPMQAGTLPNASPAASSTTAPRQPALIPRTAPQPTAAAGPDYVVTAGTHILLRLTNEVDTKRARTGDHVYLETAVPVFVNGRMIIPVGSYVNGSISDAKKAGRVKSKASLTLQYDSITLRSGTTRDLRSRPDSVDSQGNLDKTEGKIDGGTNKVNAGTMARTTVVGTGVGAAIGSAAGHIGAGAGIGAAAGALAGLGSVFGSKNPEVVLRPGTTMDMVLDRDIHFSDEDLRGRVQ